MLDSDNINEKNKKRKYRQENDNQKEKKGTRKVKVIYVARKRKAVKMMYQQRTRKLCILGDSMVKKVNLYLLTKKGRHKLSKFVHFRVLK